MRQLFDQIVTGGVAVIQQLVADRQQENVELEFKTKSNQKGELTKEDRKNLGTIISAFANSMGGLVVWGISAAKNDDNIDCAASLHPIPEIERFKNEVERAVSQVVMPRHEGIKIHPISDDSETGSGYLAILVERSERRPHRCEHGEKQYFKRIGDSSIAMEHYDIEDSFNRLVVPRLQAELKLGNGGSRRGGDGEFRTISFSLWLANPSPVSARYPYLSIDSAPHIQVAISATTGRKGYWRGGADDVIHPEMSIPVMDLQREFPVARHGSTVRAVIGETRISYRCGCYNSRPVKGEFVIPAQDVASTLGLEL